MLSACNPVDVKPVDPVEPVEPSGPTDTVIVTPEPAVDTSMAEVKLQSAIDSVQPMTGLVLWPDHDKIKTYKDVITLEYSYCLPCRVVTGKVGNDIQYDWTYLEDILNDIASRNHQAILRFRYEYPGSSECGAKGSTAVPQYIKDRDDYKETYHKCEDGATYYADWSNEELKWFTKQFYTDLGAKYGNDPRIAFLEVGFGHWAEYHIYGTTLKLGTNFPSKEYQNEFLLHLGKVMPIPWLISIDAADDEYSSIVKTPEVMALDFGNFDDSFMCKGHDSEEYNAECWSLIGQGTRWQRGVSGGEISYYSDKDQKNFLNPKGMYSITWEQAAAQYHISFMIANDAPGSTYGTKDRFREAGMYSGYCFAVLSCRTGNGKTLLTVTNEGIAPIYRDAYFAIGDIRCMQSLKGLLPGQTAEMEIPAVLSDPASLHIACDYILPSQQIQFRAAVNP